LLHRLTGRCVAFSPSGELLATGGSEQRGIVRLYDAASGKELRQFRGHKASIFRVAFSPDGKTLASGGMGVLLGLRGGEEEFEVTPVRLWDVASGKQRFQFGDPHEYVHALAFSPDGKTLATGLDPRGRGPAMRLWEAATGKERAAVSGHRDRVWSVA